MFSAVVKGDGKTVGEEILAQSEQQCENPQEFINEIEKVVVTARSQLSLAKIDVSDLLNRVFNVLRWHQVKMEPNFTSVIIAIMVLEGTCSSHVFTNPEFSMDYVRDGEIQGRSLVFLKANCLCILPSLI